MSRKLRQMVRCIALDLDGTTLADAKTISAGNRRALEAAIAQGVHVVVASGRALDSLPLSVTSIPGIEYAITSNGASIYRLRDRCCLRRVTLEPETVEQILETIRPCICGCEAFMEGIPYGQKEYVEHPELFGASPYAVSYIRSTRQKVEDIRAFIHEHRARLEGVDLLVEREEDWQRIREQLKACGRRMFITSSVRNRLEIASPDAGKAAGLGYLLQQLHIRPEETAAFGDADNDVDMLQSVGFGIAVANGTQACRAAAAYLTTSNQEDGVAYGIREILGIGSCDSEEVEVHA